MPLATTVVLIVLSLAPAIHGAKEFGPRPAPQRIETAACPRAFAGLPIPLTSLDCPTRREHDSSWSDVAEEVEKPFWRA